LGRIHVEAGPTDLVGNLVGMAYVVARAKGRFEIRESVHTPKGPRARSLANFAVLTDDVLERARQRANRPFDAAAVRVAAERAARPREAATAATPSPRHERPETRRFVEASRRMARELERLPDESSRQDPGDALVDLLGLVAQIAPLRPPRAVPEPLQFPPLARLRAETAARSRSRSRARTDGREDERR
jgi:hypothetical protein